MEALVHSAVTGGRALISRLRNASLLALLCITQNAQSTEYTQSEETAPSSAEEIRTHLDAVLEKRKESRDILLHDLKRRLRGAYADFDDGSDRWNIRLTLNYSLDFL